MDSKQFENQIKNKFEQFEPEVDGLKIWDAIESDLPKKSNKKVLWFLPILLLVVGAAWYLSGDFNKSDITKEVKANELSALDLSKGEANDATKEVEASKREGVESTNVSEVAGSLETNQGDLASNVEKINKEVLAREAADITTASVSNNGNRNARTSSIIGSSSDENLASSVYLQEKESDKKLSNVDSQEQAVAISNDIIGSTNVLNTRNDSDELSFNSLQVMELIKDLEMTPFEIKARDLTPLTLSFAKAKAPDKAPTKIKNTLSLTAGVLANMQQYELVNPTAEFQEFLDFKKASEEVLEKTQFGLMYTHWLAPRIGLGLGVRYWNMTKRSSHTSVRTYVEDVEMVTERFYNADGSVTEVTGMVPFTFTETMNTTRYLRHKSWSIPILLQYRLVSNKKLHVQLGLGYEHSINASHTGYELDMGETEYFINLDEESRYLSTAGNYVLGQLEAQFKLSNNLSISAGAESKFGLSGINSEGSTLQRKFNSYGIYTGLNYSF